MSYRWNIDIACERAEKDGMSVIRSTQTTLLLDLDDKVAVQTLEIMAPKLSALFSLVEQERWPSKSGIGVHVVLSCCEMKFPERVALQAALGSDRLREALAIAMFLDGKMEPSVLFKPRNAGLKAPQRAETEVVQP